MTLTPAQSAALAELADAAKTELLRLASAAEQDAVEALKTLASDAAQVAVGVADGSIDADQARHDLDLLYAAARSQGLAQASVLAQESVRSALSILATALKVGVALATA